MKKIAQRLTDLVGNTPLLELNNYSRSKDLKAHVIVKLEYFNPAGSVKDRVALAMIEDAEAKGLLKPGATIIEPTSGNTGVGLAFVAAAKGYKLIFDYAGHYEHGAPQLAESPWGGACLDFRCGRHERRYGVCRRIEVGHSRFADFAAIRQSC
jgi:cysteine synthase (EC 2.5.1.47)